MVQYSDQVDDTLNSISSTFNLNIAWAVGNRGKILRGVHEQFVMGIECTDWDPYDIPGFNESFWDFKGVDCIYSLIEEIVYIVGTSRDPHLTKHGIVLRYRASTNEWDWKTSWELLGDSIAFYDIAFANEDVGYIAAGKGNILKTINGGDNWFKPYTHDNRPGEISDVFGHIWVDQVSGNYLWATIDCFQNPGERGMIVYSASAGATWQFYKPACFEHTYHDIPDYPEPPLVGDFDGYRAPYGIYFDGTEGKTWVALSMGSVGRYVTDWARLDIEPYDIWFKGFSKGWYPKGVGTSNLIESKVGATSWREENLTLGKELTDIDVNEGYAGLQWSCGTGGEILCSQYPGCGFLHGPEVDEYSGYLMLDWTAYEYSENYVDGWDIYASDCLLRPFSEWRHVWSEPSTPGINHQVPDNGVQFSIPYYYILVSHMTFFSGEVTVETKYGPYSGTPLDLPIPPKPDPPTNIQTQDVVNDEGYAIRVSWSSSSMDSFLIGRKRPGDPQFKAFGSAGGNVYEFVGATQCGREYIYTVLAHSGDRPSDYPAQPASGISIDNLNPSGIPGWEEFHYNTTTRTYYACWQPDLSTSLGGYLWCPIVEGGFDQPKHINTNVPIQRTWFKEYIDFPAGYRFDYFVISFDRNENFPSDWLWDYFILPALNVTDIGATYANNGERIQIDEQGNMYLAYTSEFPNCVYFSQSTDGGAHWSKEYVSEGRYPSMVIRGDVLHLVWVEGSGTSAKLMYSQKKLVDANFSAKVELFSTSQVPMLYGVGPPSLAVSQDKVFVAWESSRPLFLRFLYVGSFQVGSPGDFLFEPLDIGSGKRRICRGSVVESEEPECPSIALDRYGNPYIAWDRSDLNSNFMDIVMWYQENGAWLNEIISSTADCTDEEEPYLTYENGALHCVWSGTVDNGGEPFNIYYTQKYPGQTNGGWSEPEVIHSSAVRSWTPVYESGNIIWSEASRDIVIKQYNYDIFDWQTAPVETIMKTNDSWNVSPVATSGENTLYTLWSNEDKFSNCYIHYNEREIVYPPHYAANLGGEEASPFTVERDGYLVYGDEYYMSMDYDSTELVYNIRGLETEPGQDLKLEFYHEFNNAIKLSVRIDDSWTHNIWVYPGEPISVEGMIPIACLQDGEIDITIESIAPTQDALAVCSALWIYGDQGGGGPMSSGIGTTPLAYSLAAPSPSPFKDNTTICYSMTKSGMVSLKVYDQSGRLVKTLQNGIREAGIYSVKWNGTDNNNQKVSAGVYFARLVSGDFTSAKKVILVR